MSTGTAGPGIADDALENFIAEELDSHQASMNDQDGNLNAINNLFGHHAAKKFGEPNAVEAASTEKILS